MADQTMKVTFTDKNNKYQYDGHANLIVVSKVKKGGGKLYLGDRDSCSMVQLRHRSIKSCVLTQGDMHGLSKEEGVQYCKVDPVDQNEACLDQSYRFIDEALETSNNVLICCHTGLGKSAAVLIYYLMRKDGLSFADAHRRIETERYGVRSDSKTSGFRPDLVKLLLEKERALSKGKTSNVNSAKLDDRTLVYIDGKGEVGASSGSSSSSKTTSFGGDGGIPSISLGGSSSTNPQSSSATAATAGNSRLSVMAVVVVLFAVIYGVFRYAEQKAAPSGSSRSRGR